MNDLSWRFAVYADTGSQTLLRILGFLSQRDLTPSDVRVRQSGGRLSIVIDQDALSPEAASLIAEKMRSAICVHSVELSTSDPASKIKDELC